MDGQTHWVEDGDDFWFKPREEIKKQEIQSTLKPKIRKTYSQNWPAYNLSKNNKKLLFLKICYEAINSLNLPYNYKGNGRPPIPLQDVIMACAIKVYNKESSRNIISDLKIAESLGYIRYVPCHDSLNAYMASDKITQYLHELIRLLAEPIEALDKYLAIDSTGFSTFNKKQWVDVRLDSIQKKQYKKLHIITGCKSNVVVAAEVTAGTANDSPYLEPLVQKSIYFNPDYIIGDPAYLSRRNCDAIVSIKALPIILPKSNTVASAKGSSAWHRMIRLFKDNEPEFRKIYHQRSNVESTFGAIKRNYLPYVRSISDKGQENEALIKCVCHNADTLISSIFEYGVQTNLLK